MEGVIANFGGENGIGNNDYQYIAVAIAGQTEFTIGNNPMGYEAYHPAAGEGTGSEMVMVNGLVQRKSKALSLADYHLSYIAGVTKVIFEAGLVAGDIVEVKYSL